MKTADFLAMLNEAIAKRTPIDVANSVMTDCHNFAVEACEAIVVEDFGLEYGTWHLHVKGEKGYEMNCFTLAVDGFDQYKTKQRWGAKGRWKTPPVYKLVEGLDHEYLEGVILQAHMKYLVDAVAASNNYIEKTSKALEDGITRLVGEQKELARIMVELAKL